MAEEQHLPQALAGEVEGLVLPFGPFLGVYCPECNEPSCSIAIAVLPVAIGDEMFMYGSITFMTCQHNFTCPHIAERCGMLLEAMESEYPIVVDLLSGLIIDDHEDMDDDDDEPV